MILTKRDQEIVEFIKTCPCKSYVIDKLYFNNQRACNRRLQILSDYGHIKRDRECVSKHYYYWTDKKPTQIEHMNHVAEVYLWIKSNGYNILKFKRERKLGAIRPDGIIGIEKNGDYGVLLVEIERSNNVLSKKIAKYEKMYTDNSYMKYGFSKMPKILYVSNRSAKSTKLQVVHLKFKDINICPK